MTVLGLTGSMGMGKTQTATSFSAAGIPIWSADAAVHRLYASGELVGPMSAHFPSIIRQGCVDRASLARMVAQDPQCLDLIERIVHPLVGRDRRNFLDSAVSAHLVVLDIPLLFEAGIDSEVDKIAVVSVPSSIQRRRVLARPGMTPELFEVLSARQMPDHEKRTRADYVIDTSTPASAQRGVDEIIAHLGTGSDA